MPSKLPRILQVLHFIRTGQHNVASLAMTCKVQRRTIYRDLNLLRQSGISIVYDDFRRRYSIRGDAGPLSPRNRFTFEEITALSVLCAGNGGETTIPFQEAAQTALTKVFDGASTEAGRDARHFGRFIRVIPEPNDDDDKTGAVFQAVMSSYRRLLALRLRYVDPDGREYRTLLRPYRLVCYRRSWYVFGRSSYHRNIYDFRLDRIIEFEETEIDYELPEHFSDAAIRRMEKTIAKYDRVGKKAT